MDKKQAVAEVIKRYKDEHGLTWDGLAEAINWTINLESQVSRSQVNNWGVGVGTPEYYFTVHLAMQGEDWVQNMALDILAVMKPELWGKNNA